MKSAAKLLGLVLLASSAGVFAAVNGRKRTAAQTRSIASGLERRLKALERRVADTPQWDVADVLDAASRPGSPRAVEAAAKVKSKLAASAAVLGPIELEIAVLAQRLQAYRDTGDLPDAAVNAAQIAKLLDDPWGEKNPPAGDSEDCLALAHCRPLPEKLELGLPELLEQVKGYRARDVMELAARSPAAPVRRAAAPAVRRPAPLIAKSRLPAGGGAQAHGPSADPVSALAASLGSSQPRERAIAADMLGDMGPAAAPAVPALRRALRDRDARVRASAARALGVCAGEFSLQVIPELERALSDPSEDVRMSSRAAIGQLASSH
jgi:hypothetical protein